MIHHHHTIPQRQRPRQRIGDTDSRESQPRKSQAAHGEETAQAPAKQLADAGDDGL